MASKVDVEKELILAISGNFDIDALATSYFGNDLSCARANDWTFQQGIPYPFADVFCRRKIDRIDSAEFVTHIKIFIPRNFDDSDLLETTTPIRTEVARDNLDELSALIIYEIKDYLLSSGIDGNRGIEFGEITSDTLAPNGESDMLEFIEFSFKLQKCL